MATSVPVAPGDRKRNKTSDTLQDNKPSSNGAGITPDALAMIAEGLQTMRSGDFSVRLPVSWIGLEGKIADTFNDIVAANEQMARELNRVSQAVGKEGKTRERTRFQQSRGAYRPVTRSCPRI